jgi:hypothetical protein
MTCRQNVSLGAYLLGALDPAERSVFEEHLDTCPDCRAELLRLAPLPGLLQRLTPEDYAAIEIGDAPDWPPPSLLADLLQPVPIASLPAEIRVAMPEIRVAELSGSEDEPAAPPTQPAQAAVRPSWWRRQGLALAAVAAVALLAIGGIVMFQPGKTTETAISPVTWSAVDPATGVSGRVELISRGWGTEVQVSMKDIPEGRKICHLVVYGRDGSQEVAGKWTAGYYREVRSIPGSSSIRLTDIDRVEVIAAGGVLVGMHSP